jgi:thiol:disulfide interchange protein DsbD
LAYALTQPLLVGLVVFTALGLGMAAPFLLITAVPSLLKFLPKPGAWMIAFKHYLGWPMLATGLWLAYVYQSLTTQLAAFALLGLALIMALGLWVYGKRATWFRAAAVGLIAALGLLILLQLNRPTTEFWQPWSPAAVAAAQAAGKPVLVDFTADWCLTCKVTEATVLNTKAAQALFAQHQVVLLRADWTKRDDTITAELAKFGRKGVPLYLLYQPGAATPEVLPQLLTVGLLAARLQTPGPAQPKVPLPNR